jgi:hypothetical protein
MNQKTFKASDSIDAELAAIAAKLADELVAEDPARFISLSDAPNDRELISTVAKLASEDPAIAARLNAEIEARLNAAIEACIAANQDPLVCESRVSTASMPKPKRQARSDEPIDQADEEVAELGKALSTLDETATRVLENADAGLNRIRTKRRAAEEAMEKVSQWRR